MARDAYAAQVALFVRALPLVADEPNFALKGGTAINLFYRDMPRLSVDIDLTYVLLDDRSTALANIGAAFGRLIERAQRELHGVEAQRISGGGDGDTRILVRAAGAEVKIEVSPVLRGTVVPPQLMRVTDVVEDAFGFAEMPVLAFEDVYAGKLCAALDRQHPRDLYDVHLLYEHEGVTDALYRTFLIYAASSPRPLHELIAPNRIDIDRAFAREFDGMTIEHVPLRTLLAARERLIGDVAERTTDAAAKFLLSLHDGEPDFGVIGHQAAADLPAIRWKLLNLRKLRDSNPEKYADQRARLAAVLRR